MDLWLSGDDDMCICQCPCNSTHCDNVTRIGTFYNCNKHNNKHTSYLWRCLSSTKSTEPYNVPVKQYTTMRQVLTVKNKKVYKYTLTLSNIRIMITVQWSWREDVKSLKYVHTKQLMSLKRKTIFTVKLEIANKFTSNLAESSIDTCFERCSNTIQFTWRVQAQYLVMVKTKTNSVISHKWQQKLKVLRHKQLFMGMKKVLRGDVNTACWL